MNKIKLPNDFWFGGACSAEQTEGRRGIKKARTIYDLHFKKRPEDFFKRQGPEITCDTINHYKEDVKYMVKCGFNSFRTSLSWARIFPNGMKHPHSPEAVEWYHKYIDECQKNNIEFIITLFHFDLPEYEAKNGGWTSLETVNNFVKYADFCFKEFGHKVKKFVTMNEPQRPAINGYLTGRHWPLKKGDLKRFWRAHMGIVLAHAKVVNLYNDKFSHLNGEIGCIFDARRTYPLSKKIEDINAARTSELLFYYAMVDPMTSGWFDKELINLIKKLDIKSPFETNENLKQIEKVKIDFIGVNFYGPLRARSVKNKNKDNIFQNLWEFDIPKEARINSHRGIEIFPLALYDVFKDIHKRHNGIKMYCSENGVGIEENQIQRNELGEIQDDYRIAFIKEHLEVIARLRNEGINIFGYHLWANIDCWSWINGFKNRYGFVEINTNNFERRIKKSGIWFKELSTIKSFDKNYKKIEEYFDFNNDNFLKSK